MIKMSNASTEELILLLENNFIDQHDCLLDFKSRKYNALYDKMELIKDELRRRGDIYRLERLYIHKNPQVRFQSAVATLAVFPEQAKRVLENIRDRHEFPTALYVADILRGLKTGTFVPK